MAHDEKNQNNAAIHNVWAGLARLSCTGVEYDWERSGTAFVIDVTSDGDVDLMTAYHVVEDARRIHAAFPTLGRERFEATLRGCCPEIDVAVVRVSKDALHAGGIHLDKVFACIRALPFGDSDHVEADQTVIIVGFPQGQHSTKVAKGVVSGREFDLFQVDAPVNPGNSGGPMLDARGKHVLGIVVARHTSDEVSEGIGFVRPARQVVVRLDELLLLSLTDNVEHNANRCGWPVWLPAMNASFSPETTRALLRSACSAVVHHGTVVTHVIANSPLHRVGMRSGDVLLALALADRPDDWLEVGHHFEVRFPWWHEPLPIGTLLARMKLGDRFRVAWCETRLRHVAQERETKRHKSTASVLAPSRFEVQYADVVLDQPNRWPLRERFPRFNAPDYEAFAGVVVVPLTANLCNENDKYFGRRFSYVRSHLVQGTQERLVVASIVPGTIVSTGDTLSMQDELVAVNNYPVRTIDEYRRALRHASREGHVWWQTSDGLVTGVEWAKAEADHRRLCDEHPQVPFGNVLDADDEEQRTP